MVAYRAKTTLVSASGTSLSLAIPTTARYGDALLVAILVAGGTGITITPPADWELATPRIDSTTVISLAIYRHRYLAASVTPVVFTITSAAALAALIVAGGADQLSVIDISGGQANASSANCVAPSVTTVHTDAQLFGFFGAATGAPTATPPAGWSERLDVQGAALGLSVADVRQGTLGASGTKTAVLSGAAVNIGVIVALSPGALNTPADVRDDANLSIAGWETRFHSDAAMSAFVERYIQRANAEMENDLPDGFYAANVQSAPWLTFFAHGELQRTQALLLTAAATVAESADDNNPNPFFGTAQALVGAAQGRQVEYEAMLERAWRERSSDTAVTSPATWGGLRRAARAMLRDDRRRRFTDAQLDQFLYAAVADYSRRFPLTVEGEIDCVAGERSYDLSDAANLRQVVRVEFPAGQEPPVYLTPRAANDPEGFVGEEFFAVEGPDPPDTLVLGPTPKAGDTIQLLLWTDHDYPGADAALVTVPLRDHPLLLKHVRWSAIASLTEREGGGTAQALAARQEWQLAQEERAGHGKRGPG